MADCIGTGFPQFPCALVQMRYSIGENGCGHIVSWGVGGTLAVRKDVTGDKEGKEEKRGKRWGRRIRLVAIQVETRIKKKKKIELCIETD